MSNDQTLVEEQIEELKVDELTMLKQRARMMGIEFSNNISLDTLKKRIADKMEGTTEEVKSVSINPLIGETEKPVRTMTLQQHLRNTQMKLVRLRITNMDPKKKDLHGEIVTVANEYLGTVKKFVPFGEVTDDGYHVPYCIYKSLDARKFLNIRTTKDRRTGQIKVESNWAKEFALEVLPQLTREELNRLATAQAAAGSLN